jgi:DUF1365 family protein
VTILAPAPLPAPATPAPLPPPATTTRSLPPLPALVAGHVSHRRRGPVAHGFRHRVYQWLVDLDEAPTQPWYLKPFASFKAADHLGDAGLPIKANVENYLSLHDVHLGAGGRVVMLANARVLGHVFDPLSVFWCFDGAGGLVCIVAEVHNTYGERHVYLLRPDPSGVARTRKAFYVSPFFDVTGDYELRFVLHPDRVTVTVLLHRDAVVAFSATFRGRPVPAGRAALARHLVRSPLLPQRVSALIRLHGGWLWLRRQPVIHRPRYRPQEGV